MTHQIKVHKPKRSRFDLTQMNTGARAEVLSVSEEVLGAVDRYPRSKSAVDCQPSRREKQCEAEYSYGRMPDNESLRQWQ